MKNLLRNKPLRRCFYSLKQLVQKMKVLGIFTLACAIIRVVKASNNLEGMGCSSSTTSTYIWNPKESEIECVLNGTPLGNSVLKEEMIFIKNISESREKSNGKRAEYIEDGCSVILPQKYILEDDCSIVKDLDDHVLHRKVPSLILTNCESSKKKKIFINFLEISKNKALSFEAFDEMWGCPMSARHKKADGPKKACIMVKYSLKDGILKLIELTPSKENIQAIIAAKTIGDLIEIEKKEKPSRKCFLSSVSSIFRIQTNN